MGLTARVARRIRAELQVRPVRRSVRGGLNDRLLMRQGQLFGCELPELESGTRPPAGDLERYFDAHTEGLGIAKWPHYFPIYERHLNRLRGQEAHLVEIGVFSGGSLPMWREYLGPRSRVTGIDVEPACKAYDGDRISVVIGDQGDPAFWQRFLAEAGPIDAVIDDGSHRSVDQICTLRALLPRLRPGGVYLCEDVVGTNNEFARFVDGFTRNLDAYDGGDKSNTTPFQRGIASVHRYPYVTVVERTHASVGRFEGVERGTAWARPLPRVVASGFIEYQ